MEKLLDYIKMRSLDLKILKVSEICKKSYPCLHDVTTNFGKTRMSGIDICRYQLLNGKVDKHFEEYIEMSQA